MKESFFCNICIEEGLNDHFEVEVNETFFESPEVECSNGHKFILANSTPKFDYLFTMAVEEYKKANYAQSVLMLYSGYESYLKDFVATYLMSQLEDMAKVEQVLKEINLSERIKGAFVSIYAILFKEVYRNEIEKKHSSIRNKVFHAGYFPSEEECMKMGNTILSVIMEINKKYIDLGKASGWTAYDLLNYNTDRTIYNCEKKGIQLGVGSPDQVQSFSSNKGIFSPGAILPEVPTDPFEILTSKV